MAPTMGCYFTQRVYQKHKSQNFGLSKCYIHSKTNKIFYAKMWRRAISKISMTNSYWGRPLRLPQSKTAEGTREFVFDLPSRHSYLIL